MSGCATRAPALKPSVDRRCLAIAHPRACAHRVRGLCLRSTARNLRVSTPSSSAAARPVWPARFIWHASGAARRSSTRGIVAPRGSRVRTAGFPDGVNGARLVGDMRRHAEAHGVRFAAGRVRMLEREKGDEAGFVAHWDDGSAHAPFVLLAAGTSDIEPDMPHLAAALRIGALRYCPACDGYEVIDRDVGVLASSAAGMREALYPRHFTRSLKLFVTAPSVVIGTDDRQRLAAPSVEIAAGPVSAIRLVGEEVEVRNVSMTLRHLAS
jgi:hypothetical protein